MEDFASAAMMRVVHAGLARQGIASPGPPAKGAHVPRADKRAVLSAVLAAYGPPALLRIGDAIAEMPREPVLAALLKASDADDLLERWSRLERFSHGRHRVEIERSAPDCVRLRHHAPGGGAGPGEAETLLVFGILASLVEIVTGRAAVLARPSAMWVRGNDWRAEFLLPQDRVVYMMHGGSAARSAAESPSSASLAQSLRARFANDPVRRWTVPATARELGLSPRDLQRRLKAEGVTFSRMVGQARLEVAGDLLLGDDAPGLAETGFLSGYSDQAHFTRNFTRDVGTTPGSFRAQFK